MKRLWSTAWVAGFLLLLSTLDMRPDPPAIRPHGVDLHNSNLRAGSCDLQRVRCAGAPAAGSFAAPVRWIAAGLVFEPNSAPAWTALIGRAADPSPPPHRSLRKL